MANKAPDVMSTADISFRDHAGSEAGRNEVVMFCDFRVFIMGVEVTNYIKDSISYTRALNGTENTCTFSLDNAYERFVLTPQNFEKYQTTTPGTYSYSQSKDPEKLLRTGLNFNNMAGFDPSKMTWVTASGRHDVDETAKKELFEYKIKHVLEFSEAAAHQAKSVSGTNTSQMASKLAKYKMTVGSCVVGLHDEVRVFVADPNHDPVTTGWYRWMPVFSGFVSSAQIQRSRVDGSSAVSVTCADIRYMLRKMRVTGNIQATNQVQTYIRFDDAIGIFQDAAFTAGASDVKFETLAANLSYRGLTRALLCGDDMTDIEAKDSKNAASSSSGSTNNTIRGIDLAGGRNPWDDKVHGSGTPSHETSSKDVRIRGVGNFSLGFEVSNLMPADATLAQRVQQLSTWQDLITFGAKMNWYTDDEVSRIGAGTRPSNYVEAKGVTAGLMSPFSVMNSFVHYLFPSDTNGTETPTAAPAADSATAAPAADATANPGAATPSLSEIVANGNRILSQDELTRQTIAGKTVMQAAQRNQAIKAANDKAAAEANAKEARAALDEMNARTSAANDVFASPASSKNNKGQALGIRNLIERALVNPNSDTSWTNRLDLLVQCSDTIEYKIQVNGMGDVCFEFPMYDFTPNFYGKYAECFALGDSVKSDDVNDEGEGNVVTCLKVFGGYRDIDKSTAEAKSQPTVADQQYSVFIKSDFMAAKYGIIVEEYPIPWSLDVWPLQGVDDATGAMKNIDAIHKNTIISFGIIEFFKRISAMSSMSMDIAYNPFLWPNRPLLNKLARRIGLVDSVSITLTIDGAPTSTADAKWIRHASQSDTDTATGHTYQTITGFPNTPFGYTTDGLQLFTSEQLDSIRTEFGIEIIDPAKNKIDDATKSALKNAGGFNGAPFGAAVTVNSSDGLQYSVSAVVQASYKRFDNLAQTDPDTFAAVQRIATAAGADPKDMYRLMEHESGGGNHIDPQGAYHYKGKPNKIGAQGIIQFMPQTLKSLKGRNDTPINPATFLTDYPTIADQSALAVQYFEAMRQAYGPLNTPYKLIMATCNPASLHDDMFTDFAQSNNAWTRDHADTIKSTNHVTCPADFCKAKGYDYVNPAGGTTTEGTKYYPTGAAAATPAAATQFPMPGMASLQQDLSHAAPSSSTAVRTTPRTSALR